MQTLTVGQAARASGLTPKAVRLYEARGLIPPPHRTEAGYRLYRDEDVATLRFIHRAKTLGLTLDEIRNVLDLQRDGQPPPATTSCSSSNTTSPRSTAPSTNSASSARRCPRPVQPPPTATRAATPSAGSSSTASYSRALQILASSGPLVEEPASAGEPGPLKRLP